MNKEKEVGIIIDELGYIGRYCQSISPKLERYKELMKRKEFLRKKLKELKKIAK